MKLNKKHIKVISDELSRGQLAVPSVHEELLDHLCCAAEERYSEEVPFEDFIKEEIKKLAPQGLKHLELQSLKANQSKTDIMTKKIAYTFGLLASSALAMGVLFKLMSWPGANVLLLSGFITLLLIFIPYIAIIKLSSKEVNKGLDKMRIYSGMISSLVVGVSVLFKFFHLMGANILFVVGMLLFIFAFLPLQFIWMYKKETYALKEIE